MLVLFVLDGTTTLAELSDGLFSETTDRLTEGFLPGLEAEPATARAECRRDKPSFGLSVPIILLERTDEIEV